MPSNAQPQATRENGVMAGPWFQQISRCIVHGTDDGLIPLHLALFSSRSVHAKVFNQPWRTGQQEVDK